MLVYSRFSFMDYQIFHSILSRLHLNVDSYAADDGMSCLHDVETEYLALSGENCIDADTREEILSVLDSIYLARILSSCKWTDGKGSYNDGDTFSCDIDGVQVSGRVDVHPKRLLVHIDSPLTADASSEIIELAPMIFTQLPYIGSPSSDMGTELIRKMIAKEYYSCMNSVKGT